MGHAQGEKTVNGTTQKVEEENVKVEGDPAPLADLKDPARVHLEAADVTDDRVEDGEIKVLGDLAAAVGELGHLRRRHRRLAVTPEHHAEAVSLKILQSQTNSFSDRICAKGHGRDLLRT